MTRELWKGNEAIAEVKDTSAHFRQFNTQMLRALKTVVPIYIREHQNVVRKASRRNLVVRLLWPFSSTIAASTK